MSVPAAAVAPTTVDPVALNHTLRALALPVLTRAQIAALLQSPDDGPNVGNALEYAAKNPNWREWLAAAVTRALQAAPASNAAPAPIAPQTAAPTAQTRATTAPLPKVAQSVPPPEAGAQHGASASSDHNRRLSNERAGNSDAQPHASNASAGNVRSFGPREKPNFPKRNDGYGPAPTHAASGRTSSQANPNGEPRKEFQPDGEFHVYGKANALAFAPGLTGREGQPAAKRVPTIYMDAAAAVPQQERTYNWGGKLCFMFTPTELLDMLAVVRDYKPSVKLSNHGEVNDKYLTLEHQGQNLYLTVGQGAKANGGTSYAVQICPTDAFKLGALLLQQIGRHYPHMTSTDILDLVRDTVGKMPTNERRMPQRSNGASQRPAG